MSDRYVVGVDTGTGGCKVTFITPAGTVVAESYHSYPSHYEHQRWVEQDPDDWVEAAFAGVRTCLSTLPDGAAENIDGIAFSAPHHTAVLLDEDDRVIRRAILWNDQRSDEESRLLTERAGDLISQVTRNAAAPTWTLPQMLWLRRNLPADHSRIRSIVFMKDYVRWRFTGLKATDHIDAGGTLFYDIVQRTWSPELLDLCGLDVTMMPTVLAPTDRAGEVTAHAAAATGLRSGTPIFAGTADSAAEVYGAGGLVPGDLTLKLATAGNVQTIAEAPAETTRILSYEHPIDGLYYLNSATNFAAASFRWFREQFFGERSEQVGVGRTHAELNATIGDVPVGSGGMLFLPFLNGERSPYWDPKLRASFVGLTSRHGRAEMGRAVMEGVALSLRDAAAVFGADRPAQMRLIGGGASSEPWRQIVADVMNAEVVVPTSTESSFGTALLAGVGAGWYESAVAAVERAQSARARVSPVPANVVRYDDLFGIYTETVGALRETSHALTRFSEE